MSRWLSSVMSGLISQPEGVSARMDLTPERKAYIDSLSYEVLLDRWRHAPSGDPLFQGETGAYWQKRMSDLRAAGADHVGASKEIGWQ